MQDKRVLVPLAEGFEETEAVAIIDVLRRAEVSVDVVGLTEGPVAGAHGIVLATDRAWADLNPLDYQMIVLPGGMPGTLHLMEDERVLDAVRQLHAQGRTTAAICAAPMVLSEAGVTDAVPLTSHPSVRERLGTADVRAEPRVLRSGQIVTSQGPGTAIEFALELVVELVDQSTADGLRAAMLVQG